MSRPAKDVVDTPYLPSTEIISCDHDRTSELILQPHEQQIRPTVSIQPDIPPPIVAQPLSLRASRQKASYNSLFTAADSDEDAEGESDGNATDDEYVPSPPLNPRKRRASPLPIPRASSLTQAESKEASSFAPPFRASSSGTSSKRPRTSPPSRNIQASSIRPSSPSSSTSSTGRSRNSNPWGCPHCPWVQRNKRTPDLKRHVRTHTRLLQPAQWVCCGVPFESANDYAIPQGAEAQFFGGQHMIGGCGKEFSRRDALKRHLDNNNIGCVGDLSAFPTGLD